MRVSLIESSKSSGHAGRGIGVYTENLKKYLPKYGIKLVSPDQNPDLVHYPQWDYLSSDWLKLNNLPTVITIHDVIPLEFPDHYPLGAGSKINLFFQKIFLKKHQIITDSYASVRSIRYHLGIPDAKLKYVYLGVDQSYKPTQQKPKTKLPKRFALYIGGLNWNKNVVNLSKACLSLNLPLVVVGKDSQNIDQFDTAHPELRHIADLKKLWSQMQIYRLGYVDTPELVKIMNAASVYCSVSFAEGFGLPALEAIACGTPLVASRTHSLPEICGDYPVYCDPYDISSIKSAIQEALNKKFIPQSNFSWDKTAKETAWVYNQVSGL